MDLKLPEMKLYPFVHLKKSKSLEEEDHFWKPATLSALQLLTDGKQTAKCTASCSAQVGRFLEMYSCAVVGNIQPVQSGGLEQGRYCLK